MGSDQIAAIRPALQELLDAVAHNEPRAEDLCAAFTVPEAEDAWAEALVGVVNLGYPHADDPLARARALGVELPPELSVQDFVPKRSVTFEHGACTARVVARFIDAYLSSVHALDADYPIDVELFHIAPGN